MATTLVVWAGAHAFAVGEFVDIVLMVGGVAFLGTAAFDVASDLGQFLVVTSSASVEGDLDAAASHLARAVAVMGVTAFAAVLAKVGKFRGGKATIADTSSRNSSKWSMNDVKAKDIVSIPKGKRPPPSSLFGRKVKIRPI